MTTNQPTDATRFKAALYAQCPEPVADDIWQRFESLTAQLATAQAQAKALSDAIECHLAITQNKARFKPGVFNPQLMYCRYCGYEFSIHEEYKHRCLAEVPKPQPVDASSLARIARVALVAYKFMHAEKSTNCGIDFWSEFVDAYNAIQPNDIALAQALAGGA